MPEPTVLIADNDPGVTLFLQQLLARDGHEQVEVVGDGKAALERLERGGVELLVCDLDMPGLSGEQLLAHLDGWEAPPPVLVISAYLDAAVVRDLERSRALRGTLAKPFRIDEFSAAVRTALAGSPETTPGRHGPTQETLF